MLFSKYKRQLNLLSLVLMLVATLVLVGKMLTPVTYTSYFRHDLDITETDYDLIFIGASRTYRSFVPHIFEEKLGYKNVLNAGSSSQTIAGSYYETKDLIERYHPKTIILGVTYDDIIVEDQIIQGDLIVYDRLINPINKLAFLLDVFKGSDILLGIDAYRYRESLSPDFLRDNIREWKELLSSDYSPLVKNDEYYYEKGFVYSDVSMSDDTVEIPEDISDFVHIDPKKTAYLDKIVKLCKDTNTDLYLVTGPTTLQCINSIPHYDDATNYYLNYAEQNGLAYHNLNMLDGREEWLPITMMCDYNHVNGQGAMLVSKKYADILKQYLD